MCFVAEENGRVTHLEQNCIQLRVSRPPHRAAFHHYLLNGWKVSELFPKIEYKVRSEILKKKSPPPPTKWSVNGGV